MQQHKNFHTAACRIIFFFSLLLVASGETHFACAQETETQPKAERQSSPSLLGMLGLNTIPNARMDQEGTLRIGGSTLDPYYHSFIGLQVAAPLYIQFRQTGEVSRETSQKRYYPGLDLKLRLLKERRYQPEVSLGLNSFLSDKRFSGEYLAASKRYSDFDFTAGVGWGRMGSAGHWENPLRKISNHFAKERDYTSSLTSTAEDLFTGEEIGFFGGIEYFPSWSNIDGLSFKADWGADRSPGERLAYGMKAPAPWSLGINYKHKDWADFSAGIVGTDKVFARISFENLIDNWPFSSAEKGAPPYLRPNRIDPAHPGQMILHAQEDGMILHSAKIEEMEAFATLELDPDQPSTLQIGRAARYMSNDAGLDTEKLTITPYNHHLRGPTLTLIRNDVINAGARKKGSPEEIWQDASFSGNPPNERGIPPKKSSWVPRFALELKTDFMSDDHPLLHRESLLIEREKMLPFGFYSGAGLRLNLYNNLDRVRKTRLPPVKTARSSEDLYAAPYITIERSFLSWLNTPITDLHFAASAGYLEETFAGAGAEVLYRPFGKTFAVGAEGWKVYPREPDLGFNQNILWQDDRWTGHLNLYYEPPDSDYTAYAKIGRYLNEDVGGTLGVKRYFPNGMRFDVYATATNEADPDGFGGSLNMSAGLRLSVPIGSVKYIPKGSEVRIKMEPMARDEGQILDKPVDLYELTEPVSFRHLSRNWEALLD